MEKHRILDIQIDMWLPGVIVDEAIDPNTGETVDVTNLTVYELVKKLDNGELRIPPKTVMKHLSALDSVRLGGIVPSRFYPRE